MADDERRGDPQQGEDDQVKNIKKRSGAKWSRWIPVR